MKRTRHCLFLLRRLFAFAVLGCMVLLSLPLTPARATESLRLREPAAPTQWLSQGGQTTLWFNLGATMPLGLRVLATEHNRSTDAPVGDYAQYRFDIAAESGLHYRQVQGRFDRLLDSSIRHVGGMQLGLNETTLDLRGFRLQRRPGGRIGIDLADAAGTVWFRLDHAHHFLADDGVLSLRHLDLRIAPALAQRLQRPEWNGRLVGGAQIDGAQAQMANAVTTPAVAAVCSVLWPNATDRVDVQMIRLASNWEEREPDGVNAYRCGRDDGNGGHTRVCTLESTDGLVVLAPDASLRNAGTASVAWHPKFSAPAAPYNNDQHPYLVWNLYRLDVDGRLQQIAVSAAKHAFHTINAVCECGEGEVLYTGCEDTYGGFSNDYSSAMAPRAEIIPFSARWGRCGSLYDKDCNGQRDSDNGVLPDDAYNPAKRLGVREAELTPSLHPGARWFVEYWYVIRDESEPWNNIGLMEVVPAKVRGQGADPNAYVWRFDSAEFRNGSMLQHWLQLTPPNAWQRSALVSTPFGRALLGARVQPLVDGRYRYEYVLFNLDFSMPQTSGSEPNLRVLANPGFDAFALFTTQSLEVSDLSFTPVVGSAAAWTTQRTTAQVIWQRAQTASLEWGRSFRFAFTSSVPPLSGNARVSAVGQDWDVPTLVPSAPIEPPRRRPETLHELPPGRPAAIR